MQISKITGIFNSDNVNNVLVKDPTVVNITNKKRCGSITGGFIKGRWS